MNHRKRKHRVMQLLHAKLLHRASPWSTNENRDWDSIVPVGHEFGSPDYERLMLQDALDLKTKLAELVERGQATATEMDQTEDPGELSDALNVQAVLRDWGHEVSVQVAASVWRSYSSSVWADWLTGAETESSAKRALFYYCSRRNP